MSINPACLVNIALAALALVFYIVGSRRFYHLRRPYLSWFIAAIGVDATTAVLASFRITPTTVLPGMQLVPWHSPLFIVHITLASIGFFGFIAMLLFILVRGRDEPYPRLRVFQYRVLLPIWLVGEGIALINSLMKLFWKVRLFDYA